MRIQRVHQKPGSPIRIVTLPSSGLARRGIAVAIAGVALTALAAHLHPGRPYWIGFASLAFLAVAVATGRRVYVIRPQKLVRFKLEVLGVPVLSEVVHASSFHSYGVARDDDGTTMLRFFDPAGHPRLTLEGFRSQEVAERVAALFRMDEDHRAAAVANHIEGALAAPKECSRGFQIPVIGLVFLVMPFLAWLMGTPPEHLWTTVLSGCLLVAFAGLVVRPDQGVTGASLETGRIERWERAGWFRIRELTEILGDEPELRVRRVRFDKGLWVVLLLVVLQALCVFAITRAGGPAEHPTEGSPSQSAVPSADPEAVRKGVERFREMKRRQAEEESDTKGLPEARQGTTETD